MVRPWTYVCRRIEKVVYLEGKRKWTKGKHTHIPHYPLLQPHTVPIPHHSSYSTGRNTTTQKYTYYNKQDAKMVRPQKPNTYAHSYKTTTRYNIYTRPLTQLSLLIVNYKSTDMYRCCMLWWLCMNVYMYVVSVDVPL
jgi:hypothetical protein